MEACLAKNSSFAYLTNGGTIAVNRAFDLCLQIYGATSFKLQGSSDGGSTYNDIQGSGSLLGSSGTLTNTVLYALSLTRCRFDHIKVVINSGFVVVAAQGNRQSPPAAIDYTKQNQIIDPALGTA